MRVRTAPAVAMTLALAACAPVASTSTTVQVGATLEFDVEVASGAKEQRDGLSGRTELDEGTGMLFTFDRPGEKQVWMAGMTIPLDVAWIVDDQVLAVDTLDPRTQVDQDQCPRWTSPADADALLEVPAGSLDGIAPGALVTVESARH